MLFVVALLVFAVSAAEVRPKYLFLLIGDGMGPNIVKFYRDQMGKTAFDKLGEPVPTGTNNCVGRTTDSAASGTALACGVKTYNGSMAMDKDKRPLTSLAKILKKRGMKVGIISSVSINDATPGTHYVNRVSRKDKEGSFADLVASDFDFFGVSSISSSKNMKFNDLIAKLSEGGFTVSRGPRAFAKMKKGGKNLFFNSTQCAGKDGITHPKPSLADVTGKAIELLDNPNGFFMMVEGGAIDHHNHANNVSGMMNEMIEFDQVISTVLKFAEKHPDETLVIVTADHDTGGIQINGKVPAGFWKAQTLSYSRIDSAIQKMRKAKKSKEEIISFVCQKVGISDLNAEEKKAVEAGADRFMSGKKTKERSMYGAYNPLVISVMRVRDARNNYRYTTFGHTPTKVPTFAVGNGKELFTAPQENSDIPRRISVAATGSDLLEKR